MDTTRHESGTHQPPGNGLRLLSLPEVVLDPFVSASVIDYDGLRLVAVPFVPEVLLHLADDAIVLRARLEARIGRSLPPPFWADAWVGGCAVARYILDNPDVVAGRRVLDLASGSGIVAIAAALAGAATVTANDIDPYALAAITLNAKANGVQVNLLGGDLLGGGGPAAERPGGHADRSDRSDRRVSADGDILDRDGGPDLILAGDAFYSPVLAQRMLDFLERAVACGHDVLVGDPGRDDLPEHWLETVAGYPIASPGAFEDAQITHVRVLRPARRPANATSWKATAAAR